MASFRFPQLSQRSQSCHSSPTRDSADQSPSSLSPHGDTGTHAPAPPMTPFQTPYPLQPGPWRSMAPCLQTPAAPPPPAPFSLPKLSNAKSQLPSFCGARLPRSWVSSPGLLQTHNIRPFEAWNPEIQAPSHSHLRAQPLTNLGLPSLPPIQRACV